MNSSVEQSLQIYFQLLPYLGIGTPWFVVWWGFSLISNIVIIFFFFSRKEQHWELGASGA